MPSDLAKKKAAKKKEAAKSRQRTKKTEDEEGERPENGLENGDGDDMNGRPKCGQQFVGF